MYKILKSIYEEVYRIADLYNRKDVVFLSSTLTWTLHIEQNLISAIYRSCIKGQDTDNRFPDWQMDGVQGFAQKVEHAALWSEYWQFHLLRLTHTPVS